MSDLLPERHDVAHGDGWHAFYAGESTLVIEFGQHIDQQVVARVNALNHAIEHNIRTNVLTGIVETVPTFRSLAIIYDPLDTHPRQLLAHVQALIDTESAPGISTNSKDTTARHWQLPVYYGGEQGPDLDSVARQAGLTQESVIHLHSTCTFTVYMLGFVPGFAFMGDTPAQLHLPRRSQPRTRVPAGSVAIAMQLTAVYPWPSPGGWHILGYCPIPLFDAAVQPPALLKAGDRISFCRVDAHQLATIEQSLQQGQFDTHTLNITST